MLTIKVIENRLVYVVSYSLVERVVHKKCNYEMCILYALRVFTASTLGWSARN